MSFYRTLLAAVAAIAIASPVFADDTAQPASDNSAPAATSTDTGSPAATDNSAAPSDQSASSDQSAAASTVDLNKATAKDLMKVKGINASKARAIVAYRKKHGDFKSTDDLAKLKGFTKMKPDALKAVTDQLGVE